MPIMPHTETGMKLALIAIPMVSAFVWFFNAYKLGWINKSKSALGIVVGVLIGAASGLGFQSVTVGVVAAACAAVLFAFMFNRVDRKNK